jgi:hypothetical protein
MRVTSEAVRRSGRIAIATGAIMAMLTAPAVAAPGWRQIATGVQRFATDGVRYGLWQSAGPAVTVLDTDSGRTRTLAPGCYLDGGDGGRFLLNCEHGQELLDARTGLLTALPNYQYKEWSTVGLRYVGGGAPRGTHCGAQPTHDECVALYDISTGGVNEVPALRMSDLDREGAPPICRVARARILQLAHTEGFEPFEYEGSYARRLLVTPEYRGERPLSRIRIDRCQGGPTVLHTRPYPVGIEMRGGVVFWTALSESREPLEFSEEIASRHGEVEAYFVASRKRITWPAPRVRVNLTSCGGESSPIGVDGGAEDTARDIFWVAATNAECGIKGSPIVTAYAVFERPLR